MSPKSTKILCGQCIAIVELPDNPSISDELNCPICKQSDTIEKAMDDARSHATHLAKRALEQKLEGEGRVLNTRTPTRSPSRLRWISSFEGPA